MKTFSSLEDACEFVGVEPRQNIVEGEWVRTDVLNDRRGKNDGSIFLFPGGAGGLVYNWKATFGESKAIFLMVHKIGLRRFENVGCVRSTK